MPTLNGDDLLNFSCEIKKEVETYLQNTFNQMATHLVSDTIDKWTLSVDCSSFYLSDFRLNFEESLYDNMNLFFREKSIKMQEETRYRDTIYDFTFSLSIYPGDEQTLMFYVCEQKGINNILLNIGKIEEYGYWNNTDHPENIKLEDWEKREIDWKSTFNKNPLVIQIYQENYFDKFIKKFKESPQSLSFSDLFTRAKKQAKEIFINKSIENVINTKDQDMFRKISVTLREAENFISTEDGERHIEEEAKKIKSLLIPVIDFSLIFKPLSEIDKKTI